MKKIKKIQPTIFNRFTGKDKESFFSQISFMLESDFNISEALELMGKMTTGISKKLSQAILLELQNGKSLSESFEIRASHIFPKIVLTLIKTAEITGNLKDATKQIADYIRYVNDLKSKIIIALIYPLIVLLLGVSISIFLVVSLIPKFSQRLIERGLTIPTPTQILMDISNFLSLHWVNLLIGVFVTFIILLITWEIKKTRPILEIFLLKTPILGRIVQSYILNQTSSTLSILLKSQIRIIQVLEIAQNVSSSEIMKKKFVKAQKMILSGTPFSTALKGRLIPSSFIEFVAFGEKSGTLDAILDRMSLFYSQRLDNNIQTMTKALGPTLIIVVGCFVGLVYFAFFDALIILQSSR